MIIRASATLPIVGSRLGLLATLLVSCVGQPSARLADEPLVTDSLGIRITQHFARTDSTWHIAATPDLVIGSQDRDALYGVRGAVRLRAGGVAVANAGSLEVRFYDSTGTLVSVAGRQGGGPGEYQSIIRMVRYRGDSLLVADHTLRRVTVLGPLGSAARTISLAPAGQPMGEPLVIGSVADGRILAEAYRPERSRLEAGQRGLLNSVLVWYSDLGEVVGRMDSLRTAPCRTPIHCSRLQLLGYRGIAAVAPDGVYYSYTDSYSIARYDADGQLRGFLRSDRPATPITEAMIQDYIDRNIARESSVRALGIMKAAAEDVQNLPTHGDILVDTEGNVWVNEVTEVRAGLLLAALNPRIGTVGVTEQQPQWSVYAENGSARHHVALPSGFVPLDIGSDYILGVHTDALGVERVLSYRLIKS